MKIKVAKKNKAKKSAAPSTSFFESQIAKLSQEATPDKLQFYVGPNAEGCFCLVALAGPEEDDRYSYSLENHERGKLDEKIETLKVALRKDLKCLYEEVPNPPAGDPRVELLSQAHAWASPNEDAADEEEDKEDDEELMHDKFTDDGGRHDPPWRLKGGNPKNSSIDSMPAIDLK